MHSQQVLLLQKTKNHQLNTPELQVLLVAHTQRPLGTIIERAHVSGPSTITYADAPIGFDEDRYKTQNTGRDTVTVASLQRAVSNLQKLTQCHGKNHLILAPVFYGSHWNMARFDITLDTKGRIKNARFTVVEQRPGSKSRTKHYYEKKLLPAVKGQIFKKTNGTYKTIPQQTDGTNCGWLTARNILQVGSGKTLPQHQINVKANQLYLLDKCPTLQIDIMASTQAIKQQNTIIRGENSRKITQENINHFISAYKAFCVQEKGNQSLEAQIDMLEELEYHRDTYTILKGTADLADIPVNRNYSPFSNSQRAGDFYNFLDKYGRDNRVNSEGSSWLTSVFVRPFPNAALSFQVCGEAVLRTLYNGLVQTLKFQKNLTSQVQQNKQQDVASTIGIDKRTDDTNLSQIQIQIQSEEERSLEGRQTEGSKDNVNTQINTRRTEGLFVPPQPRIPAPPPSFSRVTTGTTDNERDTDIDSVSTTPTTNIDFPTYDLSSRNREEQRNDEDFTQSEFSSSKVEDILERCLKGFEDRNNYKENMNAIFNLYREDLEVNSTRSTEKIEDLSDLSKNIAFFSKEKKKIINEKHNDVEGKLEKAIAEKHQETYKIKKTTDTNVAAQHDGFLAIDFQRYYLWDAGFFHAKNSSQPQKPERSPDTPNTILSI